MKNTTFHAYCNALFFFSLALLHVCDPRYVIVGKGLNAFEVNMDAIASSSWDFLAFEVLKERSPAISACENLFFTRCSRDDAQGVRTLPLAKKNCYARLSVINIENLYFCLFGVDISSFRGDPKLPPPKKLTAMNHWSATLEASISGLFPVNDSIRDFRVVQHKSIPAAVLWTHPFSPTKKKGKEIHQGKNFFWKFWQKMKCFLL